jgi:hypothetical protein
MPGMQELDIWLRMASNIAIDQDQPPREPSPLPNTSPGRLFFSFAAHFVVFPNLPKDYLNRTR